VTACNFPETAQNLIANEYCNLIQVQHAVQIKALMINSVIILYTKPDSVWYTHFFFYVDEFAVCQTEKKNRRCLAACQ